jgi:hypothetical protein
MQHKVLPAQIQQGFKLDGVNYLYVAWMGE